MQGENCGFHGCIVNRATDGSRRINASKSSKLSFLHIPSFVEKDSCKRGERQFSETHLILGNTFQPE